MRFPGLGLLAMIPLLLALSPQQSVPLPTKPDPEEPKFLGIWEVVSAEEGGKPATEFVKLRITFAKRGEYPWNEGEVVFPEGDKGRATWWLDSSKKPKEIYLGMVLLTRSGIY